MAKLVPIKHLRWKREVRERMKRLRMARGLRMKDVASKLAVNPSTVSVWESGAREISMNRFLEVLDVLDTSPEEFFSGKLAVPIA